MLKPINTNDKIKAKGWILEHLNRDKNGITGHLRYLADDAECGIFEDKKVRDEYKEDGSWSSWWPGETEGNWRDGFARLAFALGDEALIDDIKEYVNRIISFQEPDGYIGIFLPDERFGNAGRSGELWTASRIMWVLITYFRNTGDEKVLKALEKMCDLMIKQYGPLAGGRSLYEIPDIDGSKTHSLMVIETILIVNTYLDKPEYVEFCEFLYDDYSKYSPDAIFPCFDLAEQKVTDPNIPFVGHGPHTCEQARIPLVLYHATRKEKYKSIFLSAYEKLKKYLSMSGSCKSDELIGAYLGNLVKLEKGELAFGECYPLPSTGYEYCSTTELMFTFNEAAQVLDDLGFADREEWLIMNAAMAARRQDGKAIIYLCADNLYEATKQVGDRWDFSPTHIDAAVCCAPNSCKIMPGHLESMWMRDENDQLYAVYYGPSVFETEIAGGKVTFDQSTSYPFENASRFKISCEKAFKTALNFRIPAWSHKATLSLNGKTIDYNLINKGQGKAAKIESDFKDGDIIQINFETLPKILEAVDGSVGVAYGPLLYSLEIKTTEENYYEYDYKDGENKFYDTNYSPKSGEKWDYSLLLSAEYPQPNIKVVEEDLEGFAWDNPPVSLNCKMLSSWAMPEIKKLIPIGSTILRRTTFPRVFQRKIEE